MKNLAMGRYVAYGSFIHKLDPRNKILLTILAIVCVFLPFSGYAMTFTMAGIILAITILALAITHTSFLSFLKSLSSLWFTALFLLVIYVFIPKMGSVDVSSLHEAFSINGYVVYWESFMDAGKIMLRLINMIAITMVLTASTTPLELTYALEWYMYPLKKIGFPSSELAMILSIALRFIPTILEDVQRIMKAQASRGVDFEHGGLITKTKAIISLIIPLFASSIMRSEELADAMECRCYDPKAKRSRYRKLKFGWGDLLSFLIIGVVTSGFLYCCITNFNVYTFFGVAVI